MMKGPIELSPFGTARIAVTQANRPGASATDNEPERALLGWLAQVRGQLRTQYNVEDEISFIAWELARWPEGLATDERQVLILMILMVLLHLRDGSTRLALRGPRGRSLCLDLANGLLKAIQPVPGVRDIKPEQVAELMERLIESGRLRAIIGSGDEFKPLIVAGPYLYLQKMLNLEDRFVEVMLRRLDGEIENWPEEQVERALDDVLARPSMNNGRPVTLIDEQQQAVRSIVRYPLTVVSGGPGTGKTTIVVTMLRVLRRLGVTCEEIALAAPTGKAANRMGEAIRAGRDGIVNPAPADLDLANLTAPRTLHSLLGYSHRSGRFIHHENNRLAERVVIVDEGSMIDLALMERLIRSLRDDCRFVLLGDAHQLPSVEAGAVLRDLLSEGETGVPLGPRGVRLTHSYRMRRDDDDGRHVFTIAQAIDAGEAPTLACTRTGDRVIVERPSIADITFHGVEFVASSEGTSVLDPFFDRWCRDVISSLADFDNLIERDYAIVDGRFSDDDQIKLRTLFSHWDGFRILCLTRVLPTGADRVNAALHERLLHALERGQERSDNPIVGEPVMMQVNDYNRMIYNGDQGLILNVSEGGRSQPMVVFPRSDGFAAFQFESLRSDLLHSYAMTVHKAQGSEFDRVVLILPDRDLPINTREILYTALTRSRRSVVLIGSREILELAIFKSVSLDTGIAAKLRAGLCDG
jgi:exodeoxyribonuclease V alpha subunit